MLIPVFRKRALAATMALRASDERLERARNQTAAAAILITVLCPELTQQKIVNVLGSGGQVDNYLVVANSPSPALRPRNVKCFQLIFMLDFNRAA